MTRRNYATGTPWEPLVGYSRAVQVGDMLFVSGTTATGPEGAVVGGSDVEAQARQALGNLRRAIESAGFALGDVVRTRMYVTDITAWEAVGRAHAAFFGDVRPAATMVEVRRLVAPEMLIEIEADAVRAAAPPAGGLGVPAGPALDRGDSPR